MAPRSEAGPMLRLRLLLLAAVAAAYANSLGGVYVLDDVPCVLENASLHSLSPAALRGPVTTTTSGRPLSNYSLALNYAISGLDPWSYHLFNVLVHALGVLLLFEILRRCAQGGWLGERLRSRAAGFAFTGALLWGVHPLATQGVTYIVQRCESWASVGVLASLYCSVRAWQGGGRLWQALAVLTCWTAMGFKEVAVVTPLLFALFAWCYRQRLEPLPMLGLLLAVPLGLALAAQGGAALHLHRVHIHPIDYLFNQGPVLLYYLKLTVWPHPLCLDYQWRPVSRMEALPGCLPVLLLLLAAIYGCARRLPWGFPLLAFFLILAPTSSLAPFGDLAVEHRMYLPLACLTSLAAAWVWSREGAGRALSAGLAAVVIVLIALTFQRNLDYSSEIGIWDKTLRLAPDNVRASYNLANAYLKQDQLAPALACFQRAVALHRPFPEAWTNMAACLMRMGRPGEAEGALRTALEIDPRFPSAHLHLGFLLAEQHRPEAAEHLRLARPAFPGLAPQIDGALQAAP